MNVDFDWHDSYAIGVEEIDVQHRRFLGLIRATYQLAKARGGKLEVDALLDELLRYAPFHFSSEELLMRAYGYPKQGDQKRQHDKLLGELETKIGAIRAADGDLVPLLGYLVKWFVDHDRYHDREFGDYVNRMRPL